MNRGSKKCIENLFYYYSLSNVNVAVVAHGHNRATISTVVVGKITTRDMLHIFISCLW